MNAPRIAILSDFVEENWPSMDLVGEMLSKHLQRDHAGTFEVTKVCPAMNRRFSKGQRAENRRQKAGGRRQEAAHGALFNADRFLNRFWDYPRVARRIRNDFALFHLVDHSYSQLLHELPPERTIVTCHDLDTFQCLLNPEQEPRSTFFKAMMKRTLSGFRKAAFVTCDSVATRDELLAHDLMRPERAIVVPNGVHPSCSLDAEPAADDRAARLICEEVRSSKFEFRTREPGSLPLDLLHVGSTIPRKRIDVLLRVFAEVKKRFPQARLLRVGGEFTFDQERLAQQLNLQESIKVLPHLDRDVLAAIYRHAALVLLPSEREGFGLPVVEAMACGTPVVASDLSVLREVGGAVTSYCPSADVPSWRDTICELLAERSEQPERWAERQTRSVAQAARFSWAEYAQAIVGIYQEVLERQKAESRRQSAGGRMQKAETREQRSEVFSDL
jgi:glycosyltransferase involved in cell wall biosynthesis